MICPVCNTPVSGGTCPKCGMDTAWAAEQNLTQAQSGAYGTSGTGASFNNPAEFLAQSKMPDWIKAKIREDLSERTDRNAQ